MKGTLFSADFVYDSSDNPRLLEINTDTAFLDSVLDDHISFADFKQVLSDNNIDTVHIIYKDMQSNFADKLEAFLNDEADFITAINKTKEDIDTIYPTAVTDTANKFILRLAYDENALLDSKYAKRDVSLHKLFHDRSSSSKVIQGMHSSSLAEYDTIERTFNTGNVPDFAFKSTTPGVLLKFIKAGLPTTGSGYRLSKVENDVDISSGCLMNYHYNPSNGKVKSVRTFRIVYGSNLDLVELGTYEIESILQLPTDISDSYSDSTAVNYLGNKHYFEYATNDFKENKGVNKSTYIKKYDGTGEVATDVVANNVYASYFISGSPDTDDSLLLDNWYHAGITMPSGSYPTGSILINTTDLIQKSQTQHKLTVQSGGSLTVGGLSNIPAYISASGGIEFASANELVPGDSLYLSDGTSTLLVSHSVLIYDTIDEAETIELNLEDTDVYIVSGSDVIVHNGPCFIAGTLVWDSPTSEKNIEDFKVGDYALTHNFETGELELKEVIGVTSRRVSSVVKYSFSNGKDLTATLDHPLYVEGLGWASADAALSNSMYEIGEPIHQLEVGHKLKSVVGPDYVLESIELIEESTIVHNLSHVDGNHNFFANNVLAHNRIYSCFTKDSLVEMFDGSLKLISEVQEGDLVRSVLNGEIVAGKVTQTLVHPIMGNFKVAKFNGVTADPYHPVVENGKWIKAQDLSNVTISSEYVDFFYNLEIDGDKENSEHNYIVGGVVASGLGDNKNLNHKYKRQSAELIKHL